MFELTNSQIDLRDIINPKYNYIKNIELIFT